MYKVIKFNEKVGYHEGLVMQKKAFEMVKSGDYSGILMVLEHNPVFTIGTGGGLENMLLPKETLIEQGFDIAEVKRGGNITYHGPGQIVAYPIFDLTKLKKDAHWYLDCLEETVINVLDNYDIKASRKHEYRGVWIDNSKITAVGVALKRWVTYHGLAFNINVNKEHFKMINPCGITEFDISSLNDFVSADVDDVKDELIRSFEEIYNIEFDEADENILKEDDSNEK